MAAVRKINKQHVVFFAKSDDLEMLNKAVLYVRENELTERFVLTTTPCVTGACRVVSCRTRSDTTRHHGGGTTG
jgi:hypothetical protein